ncbi:MAG: TonB-dependent receptor [Bacteroidetes bacterium]|nr:TonB-dependent receptor [Bacteroidota bacterium]
MRLKSFLTISIILLFLSHQASAQERGTIRGLVTDSTSGEALVYGNVLLKELSTGASTDARGYFIIPSLEARREYTIIASYVGFNSKSITVYVQPDKITQIDIELVPTSVQLQSIEMIGQRIVESNETDIGLQRLAIKDLEALPKSVETDLFRSLQNLPGVSTTGDVSARYYVRGGASNENLVLLDGIPIYSPFHALGLFSAIDPDIINSIEFYRGGFPAQFGGRLSSILNVLSKKGNQNRLSGKVNTSFLSGKLLIEGPIPDGAFYLSGRKSYSNDILKKFLNERNVPADFYDLSFKLYYNNPDFLKGGSFSIHGFFSDDKISNESSKIEDYRLKNNVFGFKWFYVGDVPLFMELGFNVSVFQGDLIPKFSKVLQRNNKVTDLGLTADLTYMFDSKDELGFGFHIKEVKTSLFLENAQGYSGDIGTSGTNISIYSKYKVMRFENFGLDAGLRVGLTSMNGSEKFTERFEPRVSFTIIPMNGVTLKGAWGIYRQEMTTVLSENEVISIVEPWIIYPSYLKPARSIQYSLGAILNLSRVLDLSIESYYKKSTNVAILNPEKYLPTDHDLIGGTSLSYGNEFSLNYINEPFKLSTSYTLAWAYREKLGKRYYPNYDSRHNFKISGEIDLGKGWSTSIVLKYNSGVPFTKLAGFTDQLFMNDLFNEWFQDYMIKTIRILDITNLGRLPDYHRMDFTLSKTFDFDFAKVNLDFSIMNVYNRENLFYYSLATGERVNMLPFLPTATIRVEL